MILIISLIQILMITSPPHPLHPVPLHVFSPFVMPVPPREGVGGIMVLCVPRLYRPVLTLRTYHCHYKSGIPPLTCFFDQNPRNSFSTCPPNYSVIIS